MELSQIIAFAFVPMGLAALYRPTILLYLFLFIPILEYVPHAIADLSQLELYKAGPITLYVNDFLILTMGIIFLKLYVRDSRRFFSVLKSPVSKAVLLFFVWEIFIGFLSYSKGFTTANVLRRLSVEALMFIAMFVPMIHMDEAARNRLLSFSIVLGILLFIFGLLKFAVFHEVELTSSDTQRSLTGNAVHILLFPLCYILFYSDYWKRHKLPSVFLVMIIALAINFAGHRSGWIAFLTVLALWYLYFPQKIRFAWVPLMGLSMAVVVVIVALSMSVRTGTVYGDFLVRIDDTFNMKNETTQLRLGTWEESVAIIKEHPLLGLGRYQLYANFLEKDNKSATEYSGPILTRPPHNMIVTQTVHEGFLGLSVLLILLSVVFTQLRKIRWQNTATHHFILVYLIAFVIFSMLNTSFNNPSGKIFFFFFLGLLNAETLKNQPVSQGDNHA